MIELRDYQLEAVERIRDAYRNRRRTVLFVLPTAGGKTVAFSFMAASAALKQKRVLLLVHRDPLVQQASSTFRAFGIEHGVVKSGLAWDRLPVQIGMVGTIARRLDKIAPPDFIVVDEAHHTTAGQYRAILEAFPRAHVLGVTATPQRTDGAGLGDLFEELVVGPTMAELIERGALSPYRLYVPPQQYDLEGVKTKAGDFDRGALASKLDRATVTGDAVRHYRRLCGEGLAVAFCVSREHARHVAEHFSGAGIPAEPIDGTMSLETRRDVLARYERRQIRVITSCDLISEGFDLPAIEAAILLRPTQSLIVYLQQVGRALRPAPGKSAAVILDHAGNALRHGLPDMQRQWTLEGRQKGERRVINGEPISMCAECLGAYRAVLDRCPHCGCAKSGSTRTVEYREGELVEITPEMELEGELRCLGYKEALARCQTPADIRLMAKARGYKPQWAIRAAMHRFSLSPHRAAIEMGYHPGAASRVAA